MSAAELEAVLTPRTKEARGKGVRAPGSGSAGASPSSSGRYASCVEASAAPAAPAQNMIQRQATATIATSATFLARRRAGRPQD